MICCDHHGNQTLEFRTAFVRKHRFTLGAADISRGYLDDFIDDDLGSGAASVATDAQSEKLRDMEIEFHNTEINKYKKNYDHECRFKCSK